MTAEETEKLIEQIIANLELGTDLVGIFAPEIIPFVVVGKAIDKTIPGLASTVQKWIEGNPPTPEEKDELRQKLSVLQDPNNP